MEAETAHGVAELSGLWGSGTPEDETRALLQGGLVEGLLNVDGGEEETGEDVPAEPIAGPGVRVFADELNFLSLWPCDGCL